MASTFLISARRQGPSVVRTAFGLARARYEHTLFSIIRSKLGYAATIPNLKIGSHTRVLYQGFTGRQATINAKESIEYGTNIVGGVKPGVEGEHLGLAVVPSVRVAAERLKPDATAVYVPGNGTVKAIEEAIEAEIPLIVAVAEHIPIHEMLRVHQILQTQSKSRLVGANAPGIINTHGRCRLGFQPLPFFQAGRIGIIARSGTLSYEAVASTTRAGLGQSYCISMGGDMIAGTTFVEALPILEQDDNTEGIILVGEIGGAAEEEAAEWISRYRERTPNPKPIMAILGGLYAPDGRVMGHAGAFEYPWETDEEGNGVIRKQFALKQAGVVLVDHPEKFGDGMKTLLAQRHANSHSGGAKRASSSGAMQKRSFHSLRKRPRQLSQKWRAHQVRSLYIKRSQALDMLKARGIDVNDDPTDPKEEVSHLVVTIDRVHRKPCFLACQNYDQDRTSFPFTYGSNEYTSKKMIQAVAQCLGIPKASEPFLTKLITELVDIFMEKEAFSLETCLTAGPYPSPSKIRPAVVSARFGFDDAAFRTSGRQTEIHALRDPSAEVREEVEAEQYGIIYVKLPGPGTIGTLVNGAGLAMNTVDALQLRRGSPANFVDTGGKATSETIKGAFKIISSDQRVKVIFVNIFGGLTRAEMIAEGILMAFKDLDLQIPVVVRLRGTNEKLGQEVIRNSGLKVDAFDGFEDAARRTIEIADGRAEYWEDQ